uniref:Core shell protein Gag P30 domain-containing protein n=1 Tax=Pelusios castaneus TaxID=367368 RepID=A0A8C8VKH9_9SAUR
MGQGMVVPETSPLGYVLSNWEKISGTNLIKKPKLVKLCQEVWPEYTRKREEVQWPQEGSFVETKLRYLRGFVETPHPKQMDYWYVWANAAESFKRLIGVTMPSLVESKPPPYQVVNRDSEEWFPSAPPPPPPEIPNQDSAISSTGTASVNLNTGASGSGNAQGGGGDETHRGGPAEGTRSKIQFRLDPEDANVQAPLRQHPVPTQTGISFAYVHIPFNPQDIWMWQQHTPKFRDDPEAVKRRIQTIISSYNPDWKDMDQLLTALLSTDEKLEVINRGNGWAGEDSHTDREPWPPSEPNWDLNAPGDGIAATYRQRLQRARQTLLEGLRLAGQKKCD